MTARMAAHVAKVRADLPDPGHEDDVEAKLRHTLAAFPDVLDDDMAITATSGIYPGDDGKPRRTGITWGDLRTILVLLEIKRLDTEG